MHYKTKNRIIAVSIFFLFLFLLFIFSSGKGVQYVQLRKQISSLSVEVDDLQKKNADLENEIQKLKNDKNYLEEVARREYGLLKKNEIVFDFNKEQPSKKE